MQALKKICLYIIYAGIGVALAAPLLLDSGFFYPFITSKAFVFGLTVQILLLAFLALQTVSADYRPKINRMFLLLSGFVAWATFVSILAGNFYRSFWSNMERSEGLILWFHLLAFMLITVAVLKDKKSWHAFLDVSIGVSWLVGLFGLGQFFQVKSLLATSGARVDATIGNPAFLAAYMLFNLAFAAYLLTQRKTAVYRVYYGASALLFAWTVVASQTRGAVLGLTAGVLLSALLLAFFNRGNLRARQVGVAAILAVVLFSGGLYVLKNSAFVQDSALLQRLASISLSDRTVETRLVTWQAAWTGWKGKFVTGYGLENFSEVFDKHFPPVIYQKEGSQIWFDRAHNVIFDRGTTTGIVGLLLYLSFLFYPGMKFWRALKDPGRRSVAIVFLGLLAAFFIQDLFVFETLTTYIILVFAWAFFAWQEETQTGAPARRLNLNPYVWTALAIAAAVWVLPTAWYTIWYPASINRAAASAMRFDASTDDFFRTVENFKVAVEAPTYGQEEYRVQFIEFIDNQLANKGQVVPKVLPVLAYADQQIEEQLKSAPRDAKNYLLAMRHYNYTFAAEPERRQQRLEKALSFFPKLLELSPTRPQIYQEAGYSHLYLYRDYKDAGNSDLAAGELKQVEALFNKAVELNPQVVESYINLIMMHLNTGDDKKLQAVIDTMNEKGVGYKTEAFLSKLRSLAVSNSRLEWIGYFSQLQTELNPGGADAWINLAVYYATIGDRAKAIELAGKIRAFGGDYIQQADLFVQNVQAGAYEKK